MSETQYIFSAFDVQAKLDALEKSGVTKGYDIGFLCTRDLYSVKMGATTFVIGYDYSGKSEWLKERDINLSVKYGLKHCIFDPESGTPEEIFAEYIHKITGKSIYGKGEYALDPKVKYNTLAWLKEHFYVMDNSEDALSLDGYFEQVLKYEQENGVRFDTVSFDPFNEAKKDLAGKPRDMWLEDVLGNGRKFARKHRKHVTIVTHPRDDDKLFDAKSGIWKPPTKKDYAYGQAWPRKGECMICLYRTPTHNSSGEKLTDENGLELPDNELQVIIQKAKPKGVGNLGAGKLYFDWQKNRYYEIHPVGGGKRYAWEYLEDEKPLDFSHVRQPHND